MLARTRGLTVRGIEGVVVEVEVDLQNGLPSYQTVGLPDTAMKESKERVVSAVRNSGFEFPPKRVTVNLAPAEVRKAGSGLDLAIAAGVLDASDQLRRAPWAEEVALLGELALDGSLRPVTGTLAMALKAKERGLRGVLVPPQNRFEAAGVGLPVYAPANLQEAVALLSAPQPPVPVSGEGPAAGPAAPGPDFSEVRGQPFARRALEVAAAGGHNALLVGPPGTGKSMLAQRLPSILSPLSPQESLEVTRLQSVCGLLAPGAGMVQRRPFRSPHHTVSAQALIGGGPVPRPGEVSLAHHGVLFLDELAEFHRDALEALRQPLETREVSVARAKESARYPARFMLVAAMNPCPCGYLGHPKRSCGCTPVQVHRYRSRISGPLLDRIDLQAEAGPVEFADWADGGPGESSAAIAERVAAARRLQEGRLGPGRFNASMTANELRRHAKPVGAARALLEAAAERLDLSARSLDRILRVARTVADLEGTPEVTRTHIAEAVQYRTLDRTAGIAG